MSHRAKRDHNPLGDDREIENEVAHHLERTVADLETEGWTHDEAMREARRRFGDVDRYRRQLQAIGSDRGSDRGVVAAAVTSWQLIHQATRSVAARPGFALTIVATLALGIGANAAMFSIIDRLLLRPPPHITNPEDVKRIYVDRQSGARRVMGRLLPYPDIADWIGADALAGIAGYSSTRNMAHARAGQVRSVRVTMTTGDFFGMLGTRPHLGRLYTDPGPEQRVVVLDYGFWQREYGGDRDIIGRSIAVGRYVYEIIGVAPRGFTGIELSPTDIWLPGRAAGDDVTGGGPWGWEDNRSMYWLFSVVRLAPGSNTDVAGEQLTARHRAARAGLRSYDPEAEVIVAPIVAARGPNPSGEARVAAWLGGVAIIVLLISCANVANLQLSRSLTRRREIGIRLALGVGRQRLIGQLMLESMVLAVTAGAAALAIAHWGGGVVRSLLLPGLAWPNSMADRRVLAFTLVVSLLVGLLAGAFPAVHGTRADIVESLRTGARQAGDGRVRTRGVLVVAQVTLSTILLIGAAAFITSLRRVDAIDVGFDAEALHVVQFDLDAAGGASLPRQWWQDEARRLATLPGIDAVTYTSIIPFWSSYSTTFEVPGRDSIPRLDSGGPHANAVGPDYFRVAGTRILQGRAWSEADLRGDAGRVMVVGRTLAELVWPHESPLGQCVRVAADDAPCTTVIGIAEDVRAISVFEEQNASYYVPFGVIPDWDPRALLIRTDAGAEGGWDAVRNELDTMLPARSMITIQPLADFMSPQVRQWELGAAMFSAFGALALLVAGVGLYSVLVFNVEYRRHELGIRSALGATVSTLARLVIGEGMLLIAIGSAVGGLLAAAVSGRVEPLLYRTSVFEPLVLMLVTGTLLVTALVATTLPAFEAARTDPNKMLRAE